MYGGDEMKVSMASRNEIIENSKNRYKKSKKRQRSIILNELTLATGLSRDHLARRLREPLQHKSSKKAQQMAPKFLKKRGPRARYGRPHQEALIRLWSMLGCIASKRLKAALPSLLNALERFNHPFIDKAIAQDLSHISASTIDRLLSFERKRLMPYGRSVTKPGTLLKSQIPIRRGTDWDEVCVGFCEIDLVAHCGSSPRGEYLFTLDLTDVCSGWTECMAVINKAQVHVFDALLQLRQRLPFALKGIDSDNGSEFINAHLFRYCESEDIVFTRGRPETSNDGCYVEQKNWSVVRQNIGYARFEGERPLRIMNQYYDALRLLNNFFLPSAKLIEKQRDGARVRRKHDKPLTPYNRILNDPRVPTQTKHSLKLLFESIDPYLLDLKLRDLLKQLACYAIPNK